MTPHDFRFHLRMTVPTLIVLVVAAGMRMKLGDREPDNRLERGLEIMGRTGLSAFEEGELTAGYYEGLLDGAQKTARGSRGLLSNLSSLKPAPPDWLSLSQTPAVRWRDDFLVYDMQPNIDIPMKGDRLQTNRWGYRDRDYEKAKPPGVWRIALVGSSICMGTGVPIDGSYEALMEASLNANPPCKSGLKCEIFNMAVPGHMITQQLEMATELAPEFQPDVVLLTVHYLAFGPEWSSHIATLVQEGRDLKYPFLKELAEKTRLRKSDSKGKMGTKMGPYRLEVIEDVLRYAQADLEKKGIRFAVLLVPFPAQKDLLKRQTAEVLRRVSDLNLPVINALPAFDGRTQDELRLREWDNHPNALGHRLIFEVMDKQVREDAKLRDVIGGCAASGG
ncbi:MAG: hypothetical protein DCC65_18370 [Planctomycetota bacterium]|nr:MAG: hypothetical protein DCC65_18370 [Planctomycetota bacterium]